MKKITLFLIQAGLLFSQTAQFPNAVANTQQLGLVANGVSGKLNNSITTSSTSLNVTNGTCTLAGQSTACNVAYQVNMFITVDTEIMQICSIGSVTGATTLNFGTVGTSCPSISGRGLDGTQIAAHTGSTNSAPKYVYNNITAWTHNSNAKEIEAIESSVIGIGKSTLSFGAKCDGITDDTVAVQNALNSLGPNQELRFTCQSIISSTLYLPTYADGAKLTGAGFGLTPPAYSSLTTSLLAKSGVSPFKMLISLARYTTINGLTINCNNVGINGFVAAQTLGSKIYNLYTAKCTGDGLYIGPSAGPQTTTTSQINSGSGVGSTVTVTTVSLPGLPLGSTNCQLSLIEPGTANEEILGYNNTSGLTLTRTSGTATKTHAIGSVIGCNGNNNGLQFYSNRSDSNAGWGVDIEHQSDGNAINFYNPTWGANTLGGGLLSGSGLHVYGGLFEGNGGPIYQLGDLVNRAVINSYFSPPEDLESSTNSIVGICGLNNVILFANASFYTPPTASTGCSTPFSYTEFGVGFGGSQDVATSASLVTVKTGNGSIDVEPNDPNSQFAGGVTFKKADGTILNRLMANTSATGAMKALGTSTADITKGQWSVDCGFSCAGGYEILTTILTTGEKNIQGLASNSPADIEINGRGGNVKIGGSGSNLTAPSTNYIASETAGSANNAIIVTSPVTLTPGTKLIINLTHTLQAGANTIDCICNGTDSGAIALKSHYSIFNNIANAYIGGPGASFITVIWTGNTKWVDAAQ